MLPVFLFVLIVLLYSVGIVIRRLYFSPISHFPGPRIAAATFWYELYYDVIRKGKYTWRIREMHKKYGPIIRINPYEIHVNDATFYDQIYVGSTRKTEKWAWSAKMFGTSLAAVGTTDHDLHRVRRSALNPFFSKRSVSHLERIVQENIDKQMTRLSDSADMGRPVNIIHAFACLSADVISSFAFGKSYNLLDSPDFSPGWHEFMMELSRGTHLMKQFGWAYTLMTLIPESIVSVLHPLTRKLFNLRTSISNQIVSIMSELQNSFQHKSLDAINHHTIFHDLLNSSLPPEELTLRRLTDEALTLIGAGTVTTAYTLATTVYYVLSNPHVHYAIRTEIATAYANQDKPPQKLTWNELEHLPYLAATITEGLRLSYGVSHRLQRVSPDVALHYREWVIPPGTPVSMTQMFIHQDSSIFPSPLDFIPERWLSQQNRHAVASRSYHQDLPSPSVARSNFHPFSRGTRSCVGQNLAYAELYLTIGALFAPIEKGGLEMELFQTDEGEVRVEHDYFNPAPRENAKGIRILVRGKKER